MQLYRNANTQTMDKRLIFVKYLRKRHKNEPQPEPNRAPTEALNICMGFIINPEIVLYPDIIEFRGADRKTYESIFCAVYKAKDF